MNQPAPREINWNATADDAGLVRKILDRAQDLRCFSKRNRINVEMDITACHLNGTPLRLADWLAADEFNFTHDLSGIALHMDRVTGQLTAGFLPRFAA